MQRNIKVLSHDRGFLLFNHNSHINYSTLAARCIEQLKHHMPDIPVAVAGFPVMNADGNYVNVKKFENNRKVFGNQAKPWHNLSRVQAYELSPFENTIVLDTDYMATSNALEKLFDCDQPLQMHRAWYDIRNTTVENIRMGKSELDMFWATVLKFRKCDQVAKFFTLWQSVLHNWKYYADLYYISKHIVRNDFAVTIALHQLNNHNDCSHCEIPWPIHTTRDMISVQGLTRDKIFLFDNHGQFTVKFDCHILNKESLQDAC